MDTKVLDLIQKANDICQKHGKGAPGNRYPKELKNIVSSLVNDHGLSVLQITRQIPISGFSAREWSRKTKKNFQKISINNNEVKKKSPAKKRIARSPQTTWISLQILLLALQLFLHSVD